MPWSSSRRLFWKFTVLAEIPSAAAVVVDIQTAALHRNVALDCQRCPVLDIDAAGDDVGRVCRKPGCARRQITPETLVSRCRHSNGSMTRRRR